MTRKDAPPVRPGRGRRPSAAVRAAVLDATSDLMFEGGVPSVTFDRVAAHAGVSKTTVYKWWPTPGALAAEAYFARTEETLEFPDTGDLRTDILTQLRAFVDLLTGQGGGRVIAQLIGAAQTDPVLSAAVSESYTKPRRQLAVDCFERARERGQLRPDVDLDILVDQLWGACYNRLLVPDEPITTEFADALVENTLRGAASPEYRADRLAARESSRTRPS
ncbi:MAG: TetR/AcrR family transcriptional regulator [Aeromicrobium sp.]